MYMNADDRSSIVEIIKRRSKATSPDGSPAGDIIHVTILRQTYDRDSERHIYIPVTVNFSLEEARTFATTILDLAANSSEESYVR